MSHAAKSIVAWGVYGFLGGAALLFQTDLTLQLLGFKATSEHWVLVVALTMTGLGFYYIVLGATEVRQFFVISVMGRTIFFLVFSLFIVLGKAPVSMLLFGVIDIVTALWTAVAIYCDKKTHRVTA